MLCNCRECVRFWHSYPYFQEQQSGQIETARDVIIVVRYAGRPHPLPHPRAATCAQCLLWRSPHVGEHRANLFTDTAQLDGHIRGRVADADDEHSLAHVLLRAAIRLRVCHCALNVRDSFFRHLFLAHLERFQSVYLRQVLLCQEKWEFNFFVIFKN